MFCTMCGTQLPDDAAFCSRCGKSTGAVTGAPREAAERWEFTQKTFPFKDDNDDPLIIEKNVSGLEYILRLVEGHARDGAIDLRRDGWEPDESMEAMDLWKAQRVQYEIKKGDT